MPRKPLGTLVAAAGVTVGLTLVTPAISSTAVAAGWDVSAQSARRSCVHRPGCFVKSLIGEAGKSVEVRRIQAELHVGLSRIPRQLAIGEYAISIFR
ncbi:hypothetical protein [Kitasatospora sp. NBC_01300]|uniref:hypothetical protein n=1 Tax=Kitasatospora sp. NBC_01300 TaxID=2903574 RepID=UPI00352C5A15|nr:hypothetical protein OG556_03810 [Kitasatospora sp. NBC_01300]